MRALACWLALGAAVGCAHLADGTGPPASVQQDPAWRVAGGLRFFAQRDAHGCGPAALAMMLGAWGRPAAHVLGSFEQDRDGQGVTAGQLRDVARREGLSAYVFPGTRADLTYELGHDHAVVLATASRSGLRRYAHFIVLAGVNRARRRWLVADPDRGWRVVDDQALMAEWSAAGRVTLVAYPPPS